MAAMRTAVAGEPAFGGTGTFSVIDRPSTSTPLRSAARNRPSVSLSNSRPPPG
jgi:hypothetical protein